MSGGYFSYRQRDIGDIAETIESIIRKNGKKKTDAELKESFYDATWYDDYPEDRFHYKYPDEVVEEFKNAVKYLKIAEVYAQRVDWLLSGDDGEDSFLERLKEELNLIK